MNELALRRRASSYERLFKSFERLLKLSERAFEGGSHVARALCELYAMMTALQIRVCLDESDGIRDTYAPLWGVPQVHLGIQGELPKHEVIEKAMTELFSALELESRVGVSTALEQMGVVSLCPVTENQFPRMELVAGRLVGPARIIPLVELAHFAAEFGDFGRAQKYTEEARTFDPTSWELYSLCVVEGLIAFNTGDIRGAIWQLDKSINACQMDENAHLSSAVYGPNLALARKLLVYGERLEVLRHLMKCKDVWHLFKAYFDKWITQIEGGETGEFLASEVFEQMNQPSYRLKVQWMSACSLGGCSSSPRPSSSHPAS